MRFSSSRIATSRTLLPAKTETTSFVMFSPAVFGVSTTAGRLASCLTQPFPRVQKARHIPSKEFLGAWLRDVFMAIAADRTAELSLARRRHGAAVRRSRFVRRGRQTRATACPELGSESAHPRSHRLQGLRREKSSICRRPVTLPCELARRSGRDSTSAPDACCMADRLEDRWYGLNAFDRRNIVAEFLTQPSRDDQHFLLQ